MVNFKKGFSTGIITMLLTASGIAKAKVKACNYDIVFKGKNFQETKLYNGSVSAKAMAHMEPSTLRNFASLVMKKCLESSLNKFSSRNCPSKWTKLLGSKTKGKQAITKYDLNKRVGLQKLVANQVCGIARAQSLGDSVKVDIGIRRTTRKSSCKGDPDYFIKNVTITCNDDGLSKKSKRKEPRHYIPGKSSESPDDLKKKMVKVCKDDGFNGKMKRVSYKMKNAKNGKITIYATCSH